LLKDSRGRKIAHGDFDRTNHFKANIPRTFNEKYLLTIQVHGDQGEIPLNLILKPGEENVWLTPTPPLFDPFSEDSDRPYNKIVKNLYEQAGQAYLNDDKEKALGLLKKAEELDPSQKQVKVLMAKCNSVPSESTTESSAPATTSIDPATGSTTPGENKEDLRKSEQKSIKKHNKKNKKTNSPTNNFAEKETKPSVRTIEQYAQQLEESLEKKDISRAKKTLEKIRRISPNDKRLETWNSQINQIEHPNLLDQQSKADEAYNLGLESYRKEDYVSAKKFWEETLQFQPNHPQARRNLDRLKDEHPE
ncbi:MAG TPA: hypothetical protein VMV05_07000, partial [bacterium]|nr:hypothetical protein [bacterium]